MYRVITTVSLIIFLSGCVSIPSVLNPFSDDKVSVDVQAGKSNEKTTGVKINTNTEADTIVEDAKIGTIDANEITIDERVPFFVWLLMILGWLLPSPTDIWNGLGKFLINAKKYIKGDI